MNWLLKRLHVYPTSYYSYRKARKAAAVKKKAAVLALIQKLYHESGGRPGYRMMRAMLANKGISLSPLTVHKYMNKELGLCSVTRKRKYRYHKGVQAHRVFENLLKQDFHAEGRNRKWCVDFTYLFLASGAKHYNCTIIDLYDRRVVASVCGKKIDAALAKEAVEKALNTSKVSRVILHSDQGSQFTSKEFVEYCENKGIVQSMSRAGCPYDNAPMERYFNTLKAEEINLHSYHTADELYSAVSNYALGWYNNLRPHSYNHNLPPSKVS